MISASGICDVCFTPVQAPILTCPVCAERKSMESLAQQQKHYLPAVVDGKEPLVLTRKSDAGPQYHIRMMLTNIRAFCGQTVSPAWRQMRRNYGELPALNVCPLCREKLESLIREVR